MYAALVVAFLFLGRMSNATLVYALVLASVVQNGLSFLPLSVTDVVLVFVAFSFLARLPKVAEAPITLYFLLAFYTGFVALYDASEIENLNFPFELLGVLQQPPARTFLSTSLFLIGFLGFVFASNLKYPDVVVSNIFRYGEILVVVVAVVGLAEFLLAQIDPALSAFVSNFWRVVVDTETGGFRPSSFVYEPRYFGFVMLLGFYIIAISNSPGICRYFVKWRGLFGLMLLCCLMLSASASVVASLAAGVLAVLVYERNIVRIFSVVVVLTATILLAVFFFDVSELLFYRFARYWSE